MKLSIDTEVKNRGWEFTAFTLEGAPAGLSADCFHLTAYLGDKSTARQIRTFEETDGSYHCTIDPIYYNGDFRLTVRRGDSELVFSKKDIPLDDVHVKDLDKFEALSDGDVIYRLYTPEAFGPRPLIFFLHGGGECGRDNKLHMAATLGALKIAESYPDMYVFAPQAPGNIADMLPDPSVVFHNTFYTTTIKEGCGWQREYISKCCDVIRKMIADGRVDADRVFVTGMSMGGCGAIRAMSTAGDLFAACAPVCPSMMPDTYNILRSLTDAKIWVSTAYVDHTFFRHKYIVDAIMELKDRGNKHARLTLYAPEEFEKYGFADPDLPPMEKFTENHNAWVLTYNNEHGIMDWLTSQKK